MICKFCEQEIPDHSDFCPECLCLIQDTDEARTAQSEALAKIMAEGSGNEESSPTQCSAYSIENEESAPSSIYSIVGIILFILFFISTLWLLVSFIVTDVSPLISIPLLAAFVISAIVYVSLFSGLGSTRETLQKLEKRIEKLEVENEKLRGDDIK